MVWSHVVQVGAAGLTQFGPAGLVPPLAQDPLTGRCLARPLSQPLPQVGQRGRLGQSQPPETERPVVIVEVGVGQAGQNAAAG